MGVQACPHGATFRIGCARGQEAYEGIGPGSTYWIDLSPGPWAIAAYYITDNNEYIFAGQPVPLTAIKGTTLKLDVTMRYQGVG
jgi:hypothetical protein